MDPLVAEDKSTKATSYHIFTNRWEETIVYDNNPASIPGVLYDINKCIERTGAYQLLLEDRVVPLPNGSLAIDHADNINFIEKRFPNANSYGSPISMARADSPRAARRACSAHTPSPRLAPAPAAPHWSLAAASSRDGSATCSITPMRPPEPHPERPGVGCSQQQESQRDGPSSATDWLHPPLAVHMQNRKLPKIFCVAKVNPEHGR